jgi:GNAT superfamily N-acetyltransferase
VILKGASLTYFKSERDVQFPPRGRIDLGAGACLELEGLKRRRHWTWQVVDKQVRGHGVGGWVGEWLGGWVRAYGLRVLVVVRVC